MTASKPNKPEVGSPDVVNPGVREALANLVNMATLYRQNQIAYASELTIALQSARTALAAPPQQREGMVMERFGFAVLCESRDGLGDLDGGWLQEKAEEMGALISVTVTVPCGEGCRCPEYGDFPQTCLQIPPEIIERFSAHQPGASSVSLKQNTDNLDSAFSGARTDTEAP